ncbi:MAG: HAMP domain-containing histidine kinase [Treponema sp.]|nr:HAMP domain-containing histidine kinase [Candidatus Treponema equi]
MLLPLAYFALVPFLYFYQTAPKKELHERITNARKLNGGFLTEESWEQVHKFINNIPPDEEILVVYEGKIIISTFPEFSVGTTVTNDEIFEVVKDTRDNYEYRFQSFFIRMNELHIEQHIGARKPLSKANNASHGFIIRRHSSLRDTLRRSRSLKYFLISFITIITIEILLVTFVIHITRIVSKSVIRLHKETEKIICGDLETPLDTSLKSGEAEEISILAENLETMRQTLKENKDRRARFIMGISHDLRTPVALIKGYSEALADGVICGDEGRQSALLINQNAEHLEEMINELINYVKLNNIEWQHDLKPVNLNKILNSMKQNMTYSAELYKRSISGTIDIPKDIEVQMDPKLFRRAFENLFSNAMRYTKDEDSIYFNAWINEDGNAIVSLKDTGKGIAKKDQKKIFELFYRGTSSRREQGFGIGLAVVKAIMETHGWKIEIKSEEKKGTEFLITIWLKNS